MKTLKILALLLGLMILGALSWLLISAMKAPHSFVEEFKTEMASIKNNKVILSYPDDLLERKTSLDSRLAMSNDDSIGLRINLKEKFLYLEIKGIVLHKTPILEQKSSSFFKHLTVAEKYVLFHNPLKIQKDDATISKDQFQEVIAPKDTIEAAKMTEIIPDTTLTEPVMYRLYLNHGIRVQITGQLPDSIPQFWPRFRFDYRDRYKFLKELTRSVIRNNPAPYQPTISLVINSRDAEAIYRAVPKKGNVILEL